ncbi:MAG: ribonuclease HI family protein [Chloroflexia bacterium]
MSRIERLLEQIARLSPAFLAGRLLSRLEAEDFWPPPIHSEGPADAVFLFDGKNGRYASEVYGSEGPADAVLLFDGGSRGNPGPAYGSFLLTLPDGRKVRRRHEFGFLTGNQAEYHTLIAGLKEALRLLGEEAGRTVLEVRGDSRLLEEQLQGRWKARDPQLLALRDEARGLLRRFRDWRFVRLPRAEVVRHLGH